MNIEIYVRRRNKAYLPAGQAKLEPQYIAALLKNIEDLGYTFSQPLIERVQTLSLEELTEFYTQLIKALRSIVGAHRKFKPMYPNFPQQVMEMSSAQLYLNAVIHYLTNRLPNYEKAERLPLLDQTERKILDLGTQGDFEAIFTSLIAAKGSLSETDKNDVIWFVQTYQEDIYDLAPAEISSRETVALLGSLLTQYTSRGSEFVKTHTKTATDVLRFAVARSGGDISLAQPTKFISFSRSLRRLMLECLESTPNTLEDMLRWEGRWLRLGERLHPGEWKDKFPKTFAAFAALRNGAKGQTFASKAEEAFRQRDAEAALQVLQTRPGDFARRLDHLARVAQNNEQSVVQAFGDAAPRVSTPGLLQMLGHFKHRHEVEGLRTFFPKGNVAKVQAVKNKLPALSASFTSSVVETLENELRRRFAELEPLGNCYIDPQLQKFPIPFANRSASKTLRTLPRGSRMSLPDCKVLRLFLWWKNGRDRTDIDLSAALYDSEFKYRDVVSYYNLKSYGGHHSGDIVDAPNGASEFIDLDIQRVLDSGARYIVMSINSYTTQPFCDLPECFAGWMARTHAQSGEIFEPRTVQNRVDLAADTQIGLPLVMDLESREAIWLDIALRREPDFNNVENNLSGVSLMLRAMLSLKKASLYDLFALHVQARGQLVENREDAQHVFALDGDVTPFEIDIIASQWM